MGKARIRTPGVNSDKTQIHLNKHVMGFWKKIDTKGEISCFKCTESPLLQKQEENRRITKGSIDS